MDRLIGSGIKFNNFNVTAPVCSPSRYGVLTGHYASRSLAYESLYPETEPAFIRWNSFLSERDANIVRPLNAAGYMTAMFGKYHNLDNEGGYTKYGIPAPSPQTFLDDDADPNAADSIEVMARNYSLMADYVKESTGFQVVDRLFANNLHALGVPRVLRHHNPEWITEGVVDFIQQQPADNPFFAYVAMTIPHGPSPYKSMQTEGLETLKGYLQSAPAVISPREEIMDDAVKAGVKRDLSDLTWLDYNVGAMVDALEQKGILQNTLVILASDHSGAFGGRGKMALYNGGVHTPAFAYWDGRIEGGREKGAFVSNIDLAATFVDLAGAEPEAKLDGVSLKGLFLEDGKPPRSNLFLEIAYTRGIVTDDGWNYIAARFPDNVVQGKSLSDRKRLNQEGQFATTDAISGQKISRYNVHEIYPWYYDDDQLYNLNNDPGEQVNLALDPAFEEKLEEMKVLLERYTKTMPHSFPKDAPVWGGNVCSLSFLLCLGGVRLGLEYCFE